MINEKINKIYKMREKTKILFKRVYNEKKL
jgi:hypothetical protein